MYRFLKIPDFRKLNFLKGSQKVFLKYINTCLMSENVRPLYVVSKNITFDAYLFTFFQKLSVPHSC